MLDPSERLCAALGAISGQHDAEAESCDIVAPILECDREDAAVHVHMLAHACIEDSAEQGDLSLCGAVSHGVTHGLLIGYHLGRADAIRDQVGG